MPAKGTQLDELLSGYLDDQLMESEAVELARLLETDAAVQQRLEELAQLRGALKALRDQRQAASSGLGSDFSARVLAAAQARRMASAPSPALPESNRKRWALAGVVLAIAASLVLVFYLPGALRDNPTPQAQQPREVDMADQPHSPAETTAPVPDASSAAEEEPRYVQWREEWNKQLLFTLVVDMTLSPEAVSSDYLPNLFAAHSIPVETPVLADDELLEVLSDARMSEGAEAPESRAALIYFVHADTLEVDRLLRVLMGDITHVPVLRTDLAFDTPLNQLMKQIVESSEGRFAISENFAAPVADDSIARPSPFRGIGPQGQLVTSLNRSKPAADALGLAANDAAGKSTVLLLVRLPKK